MKVKRTESNYFFDLIDVIPWPDTPYANRIAVLHHKPIRDHQVSEVTIRYSSFPTSPAIAREFAEALLRACDIAEQIERDGAVVLDGETVPA